MDVLIRSVPAVSVRFTVAMLAMLMVLAFTTNAGAATTVSYTHLTLPTIYSV